MWLPRQENPACSLQSQVPPNLFCWAQHKLQSNKQSNKAGEAQSYTYQNKSGRDLSPLCSNSSPEETTAVQSKLLLQAHLTPELRDKCCWIKHGLLTTAWEGRVHSSARNTEAFPQPQLLHIIIDTSTGQLHTFTWHTACKGCSPLNQMASCIYISDVVRTLSGYKPSFLLLSQ